MNLIISAIAQGLLWSIVSLGLFISFRVLNVADMTTEGSYPLGAAVCVTLIQTGLNPFLALIISVFAGMMAGAVTGFFITICKIPSLLAGILTMTALLSVNLRVMKRPNLSLLNYNTIFDIAVITKVSKYLNIIFVAIIILIFLIVTIFWFFSTELGQALIATGDNKKMAISMGVSTDKMTVLGLMLANGMIALAGAILSQNNGYADVNSGLGVIVIGLVAIIIGEIVFGKSTFLMRLVYTVFGAIIYRLLLLMVLKINLIDANDFKMISALLIAILLSLPRIKTIIKVRREQK
ncbi:ABC transporter permease [Fusobacterium russii]|uniref:ABC transporter permease n=1 Tax=Fusobacterium russii TaxID=854 RepID=UPI0003A35A03|nr:branched-chain amino acid ABC transporter permease [Fusobacterium russii]